MTHNPAEALREALLPCPFCGEAAQIERIGDRSKSTIYSCTFCMCRLETGEEWNHGAGWNKRARVTPPPSPDVAGVVERLRTAAGLLPFSDLKSDLTLAERAMLLAAATLLESLSAEKGRLEQQVNDLEELRHGVASMVLADVNGGKENCLHNGCKWDAATYVLRARALTPKEKA